MSADGISGFHRSRNRGRDGFYWAAQLILNRMRSLRRTLLLMIVVASFVNAQTAQPTFEVASVRPSQREVGPDYNNQITYSADAFTGRNVTLRRLIAEAYRLQMKQVIGPPWLDQNEYDIEAREPSDASRGQVPLMLRSLLVQRFRLREHSENRPMRVYELTVGEHGPKIQPIEGEKTVAAGPGFHFRGDMRQFADLLAVQFSIPAPESPGVPVRAGGPPIPVLDKTELKGIFEFSVNIRPELGTDMFAQWKRALGEQLGLRIESRKDDVSVIVVDDAAKIPTAN